MGTYASQADLVGRHGEQRLIEVTAHTPAVAGTIDADAVAAAIDDAESTLSTYLRIRYTLPLTSWPKALTRSVVDMAWYYLRSPYADEGETKAYNDAMRWARDIGEGKADLVDAAGADAPSSTGSIQVAGPTKVFSRETLRRM